MKKLLFFFPCIFLYMQQGISQTVDFNSSACMPSSFCTPFWYNPFLCGSSAKFVNLYGSPNYITWKKKVNSVNVNARAIQFQSNYDSPFPSSNEGDALAIETPFIHNRVYDIEVVSSGMPGQWYSAYIAPLRLTLDKIGGAILNPGSDSCDMGTYNLPSNSHIIASISPNFLDTMSNFNESNFTYTNRIMADDNYGFFGIRALPVGGVTLAEFMLHRIKVKELKFSLVQSLNNIYCDIPQPLTLTLNNVDGIAGITKYRWDLASGSNGWLYNGAAAQQIIETTDNTLQLYWNGIGPAPTSITVVPYIGTLALGYSYTTNIIYSSAFPTVTLNGASSIVTTSPSNYTYTVTGIPTINNISWTVNPSGHGTLTPNGLSAGFLANTETSGNITITAILNNTCGSSIQLDKIVGLRNTCDTLYAPVNLVGTPTPSPGWVVLSWNSAGPSVSYEVEYKAADGSNFVNQTTTNTSLNYYGSASQGGLFRVRATCVGGRVTLWSDWKPFNTNPPSACNLPVATGLTASGACGGSYMCGYIYYSWSPVSGATLYEFEYTVYKASTGQSYVGTMTSGTNSIYYGSYPSGITGPGWAVKFRVRSRCSSGAWTNFSSWSTAFAI